MGSKDPIALSVRNLSSLSAAEFGAARRALEGDLRAQGLRIAPTTGAEVRVTLSESLDAYLWVAEIARGEDRQVILSPFPRAAPQNPSDVPTVTLEKSLLWEQRDPILDVRGSSADLLVLGTAKVALYRNVEQHWELVGALAVTPAKPSRDARGLLHLEGDAFRAHLSGTICEGSIHPSFTMQCKTGVEWRLPAGARADFAPGRNYFQNLRTGDGIPVKGPPFYAAARLENGGWIFAELDGRSASWGSDIAAVASPCGGRVLGTKPGDGADRDTVQAFEIIEGHAQPIGLPVEFAGPVTALWTNTDGNSAIAVSRNLNTGDYAAFRLAIACGR